MILEENFGLYELRRYAESSMHKDLLVAERNEVIESLYDDISPTITGYDYEEGKIYSITTNPETMALKIIDTKETYQKMIDKEEKRALLFEAGLEILTEREQDVIRVHYFQHKNNLGLSPEYFREVLTAAQEKLCSFLGKSRMDQIRTYEDEFKKARLRIKC
ncbi:hypothetical protein V7201_10740 [Bacillus sp. JJ1122]|uniref:hypothetical protein n=1 Tax=Bacillus sp. JJ1122 TaxID=3122951 RepID=UPI002FFFE42A